MPVVERQSVADLVGPPTTDERLSLLRAAGLDDLHGLVWLVERAEELAHVDTYTAEALCELTRVAGAELGLSLPQARASYVLARVAAERGEMALAASLIAHARSLFLDAGHPLEAARTDLGRMQILDDQGWHKEAVAVGEALLAELGELSSSGSEMVDMLTAAVWGNIGVACSFTGEHDRSLAAYKSSEERYARLGMQVQVAQQRANRGIELLALGRAREAREALSGARDEFVATGDSLWGAKCEAHLAEAQAQLGDVVSALRLLEGARDALAALGARAESARVHLQLARTYLAAGLWQEAEAAALTAIERTSEAGMTHDEAFARLAFASALGGLGSLMQAESELRQAERLFDRVGDQQFRARARLARAEVLLRTGHRREGLDTLELACRDLREGGWEIPLSWGLVTQATCGVNQADREAALTEAYSLARSLGIPALDIAVAVLRARSLGAAGELEPACLVLETARAEVSRLGGALPEPALRRAFREEKGSVHDDLVSLLVERADPESLIHAVAVSDEAKAQTLVDLARGALESSPGKSAQPAGADLLMDLSATYAALHDTSDPARRASLVSRATSLQAEIVQRRVGAAVRSPAGVTTGQGRTEGCGGLRRPGLTYHVCGNDVVAFVVAGDSVEAVRLPDAVARVRELNSQLVSQWSRFAMGAAFVRRHQARLTETANAVLRDLYDVLVHPVRRQLDALATTDLVIVPHRLLHQVPFHALRDRDGPLLERWVVDVAPTTLPAGRVVVAPTGRLTVFAAPDARSPQVVHEARRLSRMVPGSQLYLDEDATVDTFRATAAGPGLLHLACHAMYRPENAMFSALRLSDRWFTSAEVLDLDLRGSLVTLSACESGRPATDSAEPVGLAWAFLAAGARGAVVSQWVVDDAVTSDLMSHFYAKLVDGLSPGRALRDAQLTIAAHQPHPYYWAPFVHVASPYVADDLANAQQREV